MRPSGWRFFSSPAFPETRGFIWPERYIYFFSFSNIRFQIYLQACDFIKETLQHKCFLWILWFFLEQPVFIEQHWWLLLCVRIYHFLGFLSSSSPLYVIWDKYLIKIFNFFIRKIKVTERTASTTLKKLQSFLELSYKTPVRGCF